VISTWRKFIQSDYFTGQIILQREEHCAIFIHAHFMWGGLGLSWVVRNRVGIR